MLTARLPSHVKNVLACFNHAADFLSEGLNYAQKGITNAQVEVLCNRGKSINDRVSPYLSISSITRMVLIYRLEMHISKLADRYRAAA